MFCLLNMYLYTCFGTHRLWLLLYPFNQWTVCTLHCCNLNTSEFTMVNYRYIYTSRLDLHNNLIRLNFNPKYFSQSYTFFQSNCLGTLKDEQVVSICICICMYLHHQYLFKQQSDSFEIWSATILDFAEGKLL